jgi:hypothetical protein
MADWDSFVTCVEGKNADVAQFLENEGLSAFNGSKELAMAGVAAVITYWNGLSPAVRFALKFAEKQLSDTAKKRLGTLIAGVSGAEAADLAIDIALFIGVFVVAFEIGVLATASAECLVPA